MIYFFNPHWTLNRWTGWESNPGLLRGRREFQHWIGTSALYKNWLVALKEAFLLNFYGEKKKKEKENKTKEKHTNKQTNKKGKVEKGIQIIQE